MAYTPVIVALVVGCLTTSAQASGKKVAVDSLLHLERGQSQRKIEEVFGMPARHEFTARIDDHLFRCTSFSFDSKGSYYLKKRTSFLQAMSASGGCGPADR
jgi:hypothetical protein